MGKIAVGAVATALLWTGAAGVAQANEATDPCGIGTVSQSGGVPVWPEPQAPWLDLCKASVTSLDRAGAPRAIHAEYELAGDVADGQTLGGYTLFFTTPSCWVSISYGKTHDPEVQDEYWVQGHCGSTSFDDLHSTAVTGTMSGNRVTITFDTAKAAPGSLPSTLSDELTAPGALTRAQAGTDTHWAVANGSSNLWTNSVGYGDVVELGEVQL